MLWKLNFVLTFSSWSAYRGTKFPDSPLQQAVGDTQAQALAL